MAEEAACDASADAGGRVGKVTRFGVSVVASLGVLSVSHYTVQHDSALLTFDDKVISVEPPPIPCDSASKTPV